MERGFANLKEKLTENSALYVQNTEQEFIIQTEASDKCIGVIMAQRVNREECPIVYLSLKFTPTERKFCVRECAVIIFEIKCYVITWMVKNFAWIQTSALYLG